MRQTLNGQLSEVGYIMVYVHYNILVQTELDLTFGS